MAAAFAAYGGSFRWLPEGREVEDGLRRGMDIRLSQVSQRRCSLLMVEWRSSISSRSRPWRRSGPAQPSRRQGRAGHPRSTAQAPPITAVARTCTLLSFIRKLSENVRPYRRQAALLASDFTTSPDDGVPLSANLLIASMADATDPTYRTPSALLWLSCCRDPSQSMIKT